MHSDRPVGKGQGQAHGSRERGRVVQGWGQGKEKKLGIRKEKRPGFIKSFATFGPLHSRGRGGEFCNKSKEGKDVNFVLQGVD